MIELSSIEFKCMVTTPMFLGGAEPNERAELRSQSIKGLLRWHWRALQDPNLPIPELKRKEGELFGTASDESNNSTKSPVNIFVEMGQNSVFKSIEDSDSESKKLKSQTSRVQGNTNYLTYFLSAGDNNRAYWPYGTEFNVTFSALPRDAEKLKEYADLFIVLSTLGGLGSRTSRVMGGFQIVDAILDQIDWDDNSIFAFPHEVIKQYVKSAGNLVPVKFENHHFSSFLVIKTEMTNLYDVLNFIGRHLKQIRYEFKEIRDRGFFGLPVKSDKRTGSDKKSVERQSSALRLRVFFDDDGKIFALFQIHWLEGFSANEYMAVFNSLENNIEKPILFSRLS